MCLRILFFAVLLLWTGAGTSMWAQTESSNQVLVIPHTHWEGAVFKTREEYLAVGLPHILKALYLLEKYPNYRFVLDQMAYVRPFLERYPTEAEKFRKFLAEGRLQIAGGTDTMHDNNTPSGESIVHQYLAGKSYFRDQLGYDVTTGWGLDTFGHNAQMPQILKLAGMKSYWFQRGVSDPNTPSEFLWEGLDGTRIPGFWLPISYAALFDVPGNQHEFAALLQSRFDSLTPFAHGNTRVLMAGADVHEPEENLPVMLDQFNKRPDKPFALKFATPSDFEAITAKRSATEPVVHGELNPVFQGVYSSRIEVKQKIRQLERLLTTAEKLSVLAGVAGRKQDGKSLADAWEPLLFNEAHDLTSGVMVDKVYEDTMERYAHAEQLGNELTEDNLRFLLKRINTAGKGVPIAIFNMLSWQRSDVAEVDVPFSLADVQHFALFDSEGNAVPFQVLDALRNEDGGIRQAHIAFLARNIPAFGYDVYHAVPNVEPPPLSPVVVQNTTRQDNSSIENERYRITFDLWTGAMTSLFLKDTGWEALASAGNVTAREYDGGDFWELYGTLNGARFTSMKKPIGRPRPAYTQWSNDFVGGSGTTTSGPVFSEFNIKHPLGMNQWSTRVRLYRDLDRIDISTGLTNEEQLVRYRAMFPTTIRDGKLVEEIPFGAIKRPLEQEFPAQNWIDYSDGHHGVSLINEGIPGNNVANNTLLLSLMRSARLISYSYIGGYEPGVGSDTGLGIGKKYLLNYAVVPHTGDWLSATPWRGGAAFNNPLIARTADPHPANLPSRWGLLGISGTHVLASALKPSKDGSIVLRVYEAAGQRSPAARVTSHNRLTKVTESNFMEDAGTRIASEPTSFTFDLKPYEIKTFKLDFSPMSPKVE